MIVPAEVADEELKSFAIGMQVRQPAKEEGFTGLGQVLDGSLTIEPKMISSR